MGSSERFIPGLVSVTFRALTPEEIVALAVKAQLRSIEWGGDVHVPYGDVRAATAVKRLCADNGLSISAYGSYFRAGVRDRANPSFAQVLETALALDTPRIRVWAGHCGSTVADHSARHRVVDDLRAICAATAKAQASIGMEFHDRTLTDTPESAMSLCEDAGASNLHCNWQPRVGQPTSVGLADIAALRPRLGDVHVFHITPDRSRRPLSEGIEAWKDYLSAIARGDEVLRHASLEFVRNDDPDQLLADAGVLHEVLRRMNEGVDAA
jgi:3-dehydroshikimate dehydratase